MGFDDCARPVLATVVLALAAGCAGTRGAESAGAYVDDAAITSTVKTRLVENKTVDAQAIGVETQNGKVTLSGVARSSLEQLTVASIAMKVTGVKLVQNDVAIRP